jgi:hypothetical protein
LGQQFCRSGCLAALPHRQCQRQQMRGKGKARQGHPDVKGRTGVRLVAPSPRSSVSPLRLAPPLHAGSVAKVPPSKAPNSTNIFWSCSLQTFFCLFYKTAFIILFLPRISIRENLRISSTKSTIDAHQLCLIDSHAITQ